ncbi:MAG: peptidoglycan-binding protein, partial [Clostridia bacterium]|nr:peptidoglycan-binding protein [Clostridia bacterium]
APTAAPTATATATATAAPEPEEPVDPEEGGDIAVDASSDPESIRYVQQMLASVGALSESGVDGVYGGGTTRAVQAFQEWVNSVQGEGTLSVTGRVDNATRLALEYAYDHDMTMQQPTEAPTVEPTAVPTEAPTPVPTEAPTAEPTAAPTEAPTPEPEAPAEGGEGGQISVGADSDPESIRYVQQMLASVGVLSGGETGVYDDGTVEAVKRFQEWVNSVQGEDTLPVTGQVDDRTRQALEYAYDHDYTVDQGEQTPAEPQGVGAVGDIEIQFGDTLAGNDIIAVADGAFSVQWRADGDIDSYYVYVTDSAGNPIVSQEATEVTSFNVNTAQMTPGEVYTMRLGVLPARGAEADIVWKDVQFTLPQRETPTPEPTEAPTPEPTPEPTEAPTPEPVVGTVSAPSISIAGMPAGGSPITIEDDTFQIGWSADGDVDRYLVRISDENGGEIASQETTETSVGLRADNMREGVLYTLSVGAVPVNGTEADMVITSAQFTRPVQATPEPTEAPTPEPAPTAAPIGNPVINLGGTAVQRDGVPYMTDSSIILSWNADGNVESYTIYVENQAGERQELGTTTDTSRTVSTASLPAGIYTIYVGAMPANGAQDDIRWSSTRFGIPSPTAEPTEAPTPEPEETPQPTQAITGPISASSDTETIQQLQLRLYSLGLLSGDAEPGVLDQTTLGAIYEFQTRVNEQYELGLTVIDPTDPAAVIDGQTVQAIFTDYTQQP